MASRSARLLPGHRTLPIQEAGADSHIRALPLLVLTQTRRAQLRGGNGLQLLPVTSECISAPDGGTRFNAFKPPL